MVPKEIYLMEF